ncbi:MAG: hypothetical protein IT249_16930 [Chitinophagaceae bacterium]|nr:hypothetical protein [Chitinophagaceae bacterium]
MQQFIRVIFAVLVFAALAYSCSKEEKKAVTCEDKMIEKLGAQVSCSVKRGPEQTDLVLAKGGYKGSTIYFMFTLCPFCNTVPPQEGYVCGKDDNIEKIAIDDFNSNVTGITIIKDCGN